MGIDAVQYNVQPRVRQNRHHLLNPYKLGQLPSYHHIVPVTQATDLIFQV